MEINEQWLLDQANTWCKLKGYSLIKQKMVDQTMKLKAEKDYREWIIEFTPNPKTDEKCVEIEIVLKDRYDTFIERDTCEYYNTTKEEAYGNQSD